MTNRRESLTIDDLRRLTWAAIRTHQNNPEWEDLLQIGMIGAWTATQNCTGDQYALSTIATKAAQWSVLSYLRSPAALNQYHRHRGENQPLPHASLDQTSEDLLPRLPDCADTIVEQLANEEMWREVHACCTPRQWSMIQAWVVEGRTLKEISAQVGVGTSRIHQIVQEALAKYRRLKGIPPRTKREARVYRRQESSNERR